MNNDDHQFIIAHDLSFIGILHDIKKSKLVLQPIFECFTNALESIKIKQASNANFKGEIIIKIYASETTIQSTEFHALSITDNGIGFNEEEFKRFNTYKLSTKGFKNLGSGRIQYLHYFDSTKVKSVFEQDGKFFEREFEVSKNADYLKQNAIVKHRPCKEVSKSSTGTNVTFNALLTGSEVYNDLTDHTLKEKLLERYIHYFCNNKKKLPKIKIEFYVQGDCKKKSTITQSDIPNIDKTTSINLKYSKKSSKGIIEKTSKVESFTIDAFKLSKSLLKENILNLVSKGEVIEESGVSLESLAKKDIVKGNKYLFLVSSDYIDARDTDLRGILNIPSKESYAKDLTANQDEIFLEEIQEEVNKTISTMYPEIEEVKQKHNEELEKLKEMFLLDAETAKEIKVSINDNVADILKIYYEAEAKKTATIDASIKQVVDNLNNLDTTNPNYQDELKKEVDKLVISIPLQNKKSLAHYVARRKIVLELFQKILDNESKKLEKGDRIDEDVLHNLIFSQRSKEPLNSDLWLIDEEYIYYKGISESQLGTIELDDKKILKESLSSEEEEYRKKQKGDAHLKRTDILLFPSEGKCIIIELKAPDEKISEHLNQINRYASLINNLSKDEFKFNTFYGYLIGESIDVDDVIDNDSDFINAPNLGYLFRPYKRIVGKFGRADGSLYTEVIKYSTLLSRAKLRNKIFIEKLTKTEKQ